MTVESLPSSSTVFSTHPPSPLLCFKPQHTESGSFFGTQPTSHSHTHQSCGLGRFLSSNSPGLALPDGAGFQRCPPPPLWDADVEASPASGTPWSWLQMTEAGPQELPQNAQERKTDGPGRNGQRTVKRRKPSPYPYPREQLCTYLGKVAAGSLLCMPSSLAGSSPRGGVWTWIFFFFFPELAVLACISMPSCQNSLKETAAE